MYIFFVLAFNACQKYYYDPQKLFIEKYQYGYQNSTKFYADFNFVDADLNKSP